MRELELETTNQANLGDTGTNLLKEGASDDNWKDWNVENSSRTHLMNGKPLASQENTQGTIGLRTIENEPETADFAIRTRLAQVAPLPADGDLENKLLSKLKSNAQKAALKTVANLKPKVYK